MMRLVPSAIARSFHEALSAGNRDGVLALLDRGVVIFEQGGAEMSRDEYASHHLDETLEGATLIVTLHKGAQSASAKFQLVEAHHKAEHHDQR